MYLVLRILIISITYMSFMYCEISNNSDLRAVLISLNQTRYNSIKNVLEKSLNGKVSVNKYHPVSIHSNVLDQHFDTVKCFFENKKKLGKDIKGRKLFSNFWSFHEVFSNFSSESADISSENDWLLFFEDDVAVNPSVKHLYEDIKAGMKYSRNEGIMYLGKCHKGDCVGHEMSPYGSQMARCSGGVCAHALAITKWKARHMIGTLLTFVKSNKLAVFDQLLCLYSIAIQRIPIIGLNREPPEAIRREQFEHVGLFYQDRSHHPSGM